MSDRAIDVVLVEDNVALRDELAFQLRHAGFDVREAGDARALSELLAARPCDVVVLDVHLPGESGLDIARHLSSSRRFGIIMLTARGEVDDKVSGLDAGADIYLVKPIDRRELAASIIAVHRRMHPRAGEQPATWALHRERRELVSASGETVALTAQDFLAFAVLAGRQGQPVTRDELVRALGFDGIAAPEGRTNTVLSRLRQKLAAFSPELRIVAWRNQGYSYVGPRVVVRD
jgi:two-component system response regulator PhoP